MSKPLHASIVLVTFIVMAGFGLYLPMMGHAGHEAPCPFVPGGTALCGVPLTHLAHWQTAFTAVLIEVLALCALAAVLFSRYIFFDPDVERHKIHRVTHGTAIRPHLFQELFSSGILNRKEPHHS